MNIGEVTLKGNAVAGQDIDLEIVFNCGEYGFDQGGRLGFYWDGVSDMAFTQMECSVGEIAPWDGFWRPHENGLLFKLSDRFLSPNEQVIIRLIGKAQSYAYRDFEIKVVADPFGTRKMKRLAALPLPVFWGQPNEIRATLSPYNSEKMICSVAVLDKLGNVSATCEEFELEGEKYNLENGLKQIEFKPKSNEFTLKGSYRGQDFETEWCVKQEYTLLRCDLHGQNGLASGVGSMDDYFTFARDVAALDVCSWQGNDFHVNEKIWQETLEKADEYNENGRFITIPGIEWSGTTPVGGDYNLYFFEKPQLIHSHTWMGGDGIICKTIEEMAGALEEKTLAIAHVGGRYADLDRANSQKIPLIEVHSHHGSFLWFARQAMKNGLKVGFVAGSDDHTSRPGISYPLSSPVAGANFSVKSGHTGLYVKSLDREGVLEALKARRTFASTHPRATLMFKCGQSMMGEEISLEDAGDFKVMCHGKTEIRAVELWHNDNMVKYVNLCSGRDILIRFAGVQNRGRKKEAHFVGSIASREGLEILGSQGICGLDFDVFSSGEEKSVLLKGGLHDEIEFRCNYGRAIFKPIELTDSPLEICLADVDIRVSAEKSGGVGQRQVDISLGKPGGSGNFWVRIIQTDGEVIYSSPIFVK